MMKFFRKYNKYLLAIFASLLLVVWLGSQALQNLLRPNPGEEVYAKACGQELTQNALNSAGHEAQLLGAAGILWAKPWIRDLRMARQDYNEPLTELDFLLLKLDARQRGLSVAPVQVEAFKQGYGLSEQRLEQISNQLNVSTAAIDAAIQDFLLVRAVYEQMETSVRVTEPEMRSLAKMLGETVEIRMVGVPAAAFVDEESPVSDEEITEQYEALRDVLPGEKGLGFGYKYADRVNVEYITADAEKVAPTVAISKAEAKEYWEKTKTSYLKPKPQPTSEPSETQPAETQPTETQPAEPQAIETQPAETQPVSTQPATKPAEEEVPYYETFMEARDDVVKRLQNQRAPDEAQRLTNDLLATQIIPAWEGVGTGEDGFPKTPAVAKDPQFLEGAITAFVGRQPAYDGVFTVHRTGLVTREALADVEGFGRSYSLLTGRQRAMVRPADLVFNVQGLVGPLTEEMLRTSERPLALFQFSPVILRGPKGSVYAFRVIESRKSAAPESVDEVRDEIVRDIRLARAYEQCKVAASELLASAESEGLEAAWTADNDLQERIREARSRGGKGLLAWGLRTPQPFSRERRGGDPAVVQGLQSEEFIKACFAAAEGMDADADKKPVVKVDLPKYRLAVVAEIVKLAPMYEETYLAMRPALRYQLTQEQMQTIVANWFSPEKIRERTGFQRVQ